MTPAGVEAISRGLSEAIPPGQLGYYRRHPGRGVSRTSLRPLPRSPTRNEHALHLSQPALPPGFRNEKPGTSHRSPWRSRLHEYLGGTISGLGGFPQGVGGMADQVHLLIGLKATHCLADVLRELKKASSAWVHEQIGLPSFAWQEGYAAFTVSVTVREAVQKYIANQEEHHRVRTFREELIVLLKKAGIEYDPKYFD